MAMLIVFCSCALCTLLFWFSLNRDLLVVKHLCTKLKLWTMFLSSLGFNILLGFIFWGSSYSGSISHPKSVIFFSLKWFCISLDVDRDSTSNTIEMTPDQKKEQQEREQELHASSLRVPRRHVFYYYVVND